MLMVGATIVFGGLVVAAAISQASTSQNSYYMGASALQASQGKLISLVYSSTVPSPSTGCVLALYNYGSSAFTTSAVYIDGVLYPTPTGGYQPVATSSLQTYSFATASCSPVSGHVFTLADSGGNEISIGT